MEVDVEQIPQLLLEEFLPKLLQWHEPTRKEHERHFMSAATATVPGADELQRIRPIPAVVTMLRRGAPSVVATAALVVS